MLFEPVLFRRQEDDRQTTKKENFRVTALNLESPLEISNGTLWVQLIDTLHPSYSTLNGSLARSEKEEEEEEEAISVGGGWREVQLERGGKGHTLLAELIPEHQKG